MNAISRKGIALLLVLMTLVVATSAIVALSRGTLDARLVRKATIERMRADELLAGAQQSIVDWLHRHAGHLVLPPDVISPRFVVLDDSFSFAQVHAHLVITAFDQCGLPSSTHRTLQSDRFLPAGIPPILDDLGRMFPDAPGLDLLAAMTDKPVFPSVDREAPLALGEELATHNPPRRGGQVLCNINTAPLPFIESVYAARGLDGIDAIMQARQAGRTISPGSQSGLRSTGISDSLPLPVAMSTSWAFRIDCHIDNTMRSWWVVYADAGSNWERVQQLVINE